MTPEQLKASILQYAIQGKLVEQRPEEGTAEDLYKSIQEEKQKLIREGKIKKEKPLAEITEDEIPFDIPENWKWCRLSQIIDVRDGTHDSPKYVPDGVPLVTSKNLSNGIIDYSNIKYITQEDADKINERSAVNDNDILFAMIGSIGNPVLVKKDREFCIKNMALFKKYDNTNMDMNFMYWFFLYAQYALKAEASGGVQSFISLGRFREYLIPLPPYEEQGRIAKKIEELLPFVDHYEASYEKLEQFNAKFPEDMKKSILQYAIQGKLVEQRSEEGTAEDPYKAIQEEKQKLIKEGKLKKTRALPLITEEEIPFDFPKTWKICYIDDIAFVTKLAGFEYTKYIADNLVIDGIPLFKGKNVQNGKLVLEFESFIPESVSDELPRSQITKKCLLTPYVGTIGNIAIFDGTFKAHLGSNVGKIEILNSNDNTFVLEEYLLWYLRSQYGYNELTKYKKATAQESISIDAIRNVIIAIPPLEEQHRIVAKIEELLPYCDRLVK